MKKVNDVSLFQVILIESINTCNRSCWFCKYGQREYLKDKPNEHMMTWQMIEEILDQLSKLNFQGRLTWNRINEPFQDNRIFDIISRSREMLPNAHLTLITNGDQLNQGKINKIFDAGLDFLTISAYSNEVLEKLKSIHHESGKYFVKDYRPREFKKMKILNQGGVISRIQAPSRYLNLPCLRPFTAINLNVYGQALICCSDILDQMVVGDIRKNTISDIWFGKELRQLREILRDSRKGIKICEKCNHNGYGHGIYGERPTNKIIEA